MKKFAYWTIVALLALPATALVAEEAVSGEFRGVSPAMEERWSSWWEWGQELTARLIGRSEHGPLIDPSGRSARARSDGAERVFFDGRRFDRSPSGDVRGVDQAGQHGPLIDPSGIARVRKGSS